MRLIPWNQRTNGLMNSLFDDLWTGELSPRTWGPAVDVVETRDQVTVRAEIPGIDPGEVEVSVTGDLLELSGVKREEEETKDENRHRVERRYGSFARAIQLPCEVDTEKAVAEARDGVLTVTFDKQEQDKARKIPVKVR